MKEKKKNFFAVLGRVLSCVGEAVYQYHYRLGVFVLRRLRRLGRFLSRVTLKPRRSVRYVWLVLVSRPIHRFFRRIWRMLTGIPSGETEIQGGTIPLADTAQPGGKQMLNSFYG